MTAVTGSPFAADDGSVPAAVAELLARHAAGTAGAREVVVGLAGHRVLVPLLEVSAADLEGDAADPCAGQDRAMAAVSVRLPDGSRAGLAFTGMAPLLRWDARARPMPVEAARAASAVLAEGGSTLLIDPGSPHACRIAGIGLVRLAAGGAWPEPWEDPEVRRAVLAELAPAMRDGLRVRLGPPTGAGADGVGMQGAGTQGAGPRSSPDLVVHLRFTEELGVEVAQQRAERVARLLAGSELVRAVLDGALGVTVD